MNAKLVSKIVVSALLLGGVLYAVDVKGAFTTASSVDLELLVFGLALNIAGAMYFNALQYKWTLFDRSSVSQWEFVRIGFIIRFYMLLLPGAVTTGYRWWRFKQLGIDSVEAIHLMIVNKSVQLILAFFFILIALFWNQALTERLGGTGGNVESISVAMVPVFLAITGVVALVRSRTMQVALGRMLRKGRLEGIAEKWERYVTAVQGMSRKVLVGNVGLGLVSHLLIIASQQCVCFGIGLELSFLDVAFVRSLVVILLSLPITIAGLGLREAGFVGGLALLGGAPESALALSLLLLFFQLVIGAVGLWLVTVEAVASRAKG